MADANDRVIGSFGVPSLANRLGDTEFEEEFPSTLPGVANEFESEHTLA